MAEIAMMLPDQARSFMEKNKPESYTLLDVRQEWEYEEEHLPGALLVPLSDLPDRMDELDAGKPLLVYCRTGGRSIAAASLLQGQGFTDVSNLVGGISGWSGGTAFGPMELGLVEFTGRETPEEVVLKAYAMENALQIFYTQRADWAETMERIELFMELAVFEDRHKDTLFTLYNRLTGSDIDLSAFEKLALESEGVVEGGVEIAEFLDRHPDAFDDEQGILQLSAMIEAQALDYYLRCAKAAQSEETRKVLQLLAREEKAHLKLLGKSMDMRDI
ncbi:rhodanese-like domain-containing protein [Pseudodesulfovibrio portus]|uniref:Sulfurtransferase n=1 Tax=Pseudodesulfovibrio portus TaxID=231439 RepID=A0ABM8AP24_9BACT|nr:rhodanese-like domain-containing protein [Pseudodesulfovibrio portus]BDQ33146.1 sulfurtransferase [Pseudodesulfovibrio portus]